MDLKHIRNFSIIAHIDHGKSTLADRLLEITGTIEKRKMQDQVLDSMELERERGITIKMTPVRMVYHPPQINADFTQTNADKRGGEEFLYSDLTYKLRGAFFEVRKKIGLGHKESVYHNALEIEFAKAGIKFESKKNIPILYEGKNIGVYQPDFVIEDKVIIELKALPEIGRQQTEQVWSYLKGCSYRLALLVNYGSTDLEIKRVVYDTARDSFASSGQRTSASNQRESAGVSNQVSYILNLIDTPGHIDFSYEVSRALKAVEGALLLVDATQGVQAQTLSVLAMAKEAGLVIIPAVNKVDSPLARTAEVKQEVMKLLDCSEEDVLEVSGKTGQGVAHLLEEIVRRVPPPVEEIPESGSFRGLVFDFKYSTHTGVIVYIRGFDGSVRKGEKLLFKVANREFTPIEVGIFMPAETPCEVLGAGEIGYIVTGIKEPGIASVGDTITMVRKPLPELAGYMTPRPVVWASVYPENADDFNLLRQALGRLRLSDSSFSYEEESSGLLGRGFRCGFLGMLHLEIITERLRREFQLELVVTTPSITYEVVDKRGKRSIYYSPTLFPEYGEIEKVFEPWVAVTIISPSDYLGPITQLLFKHEAVVGETTTWNDNRTSIELEMPLRELMRNFFDELKSASSGFASLSYKIGELREADVVKLDILVADEVVSAFSRVVSRKRVEEEAEAAVDKLFNILPRQMFTTKIQGKALGRIMSSQTLSAMKKDVTQHMYGGDITRKMKLRKKQKKGKKKMKELGRGRANIPQDVFIKMMRSE
ncbi:MAG: GTP-binding protein LepA [Parcubacteria group bacterium GW2011_GWA2_47_16]|nr:MAG: GTP-binding protein LepA [Parcubacteria group bacterium GW2011_GWA2_47_16]